MVMETPGPQEVGREFVRQYYTMLHEAPLHLHRFYSNNSAFVHGGVEKAGNEQPPVIGQEAIHKKIVSLGFNDCHAKIRQVDSQATVEDSVVVQVSGELSNNGEPMRRFMQTFVLVPQMPKKFYVHNDIFRYQDEVFHDEEGDPDESERFITDPRQNENGTTQEPPTVVSQEVQSSYYDPVPMSNGTSHEIEPIKAQEPVPVVIPQPAVVPPSIQQVSAPESDSALTSSSVEASLEEPSSHSSSGEELKLEPQVAKSSTPTPAESIQQEPQETSSAESKPVSWAALASKNTSGGNIPVPPSTGFSGQQASHHVSKPPLARNTEPPKVDSVVNTQPPQSQRVPRPPRDRFADRDRNSLSRGDGDGDNDSLSDRRSNSVGGGNIGYKYADKQQLFVGNLPQHITERELKEFFEQYGKVEELRINTKSGGGKVPNFGFVVFESADTVQIILKAKIREPIMYNGEHRLNVEEKKPRGSDGMRGRGGMMRGGSMGGQMRSGPPYGMGGGRGGMKNGGGGGFGRSDMRGSPNLGPRGGMSQGRR